MGFRRLLLLLALLTVAGCGDESGIDPAVKAATFRFADGVAPADREWILAAVDQVRPEARQLIDNVDGMTLLSTHSEPGSGAVGLMREVGPGSYEVTFNLAYLNGERKLDRDSTVAHELGHVIDAALVAPELRDRLAASLPPSGGCVTEGMGDCTSAPERFADTFAKWALRGAVSVAGAGYAVATPASLEDWGAPLASLAIDVEVAAR
jgi:hypothetical protein